MKTVLGQLIETLENIIEDESVSPDDAAHYSVAIIHVRRLLEAEKTQIIEGYNEGYGKGSMRSKVNGEQYFEETFK